MKKIKGKSVLGIVKKYHPEVDTVIDATKPIVVEVSREDCRRGKFQEPDACAMAKALEREHDGAIISLKVAYIIDGNKATRYVVPESVAREVVSFDRAKLFAPGEYSLRPPSKADKIGGRTRPQYAKNRKPSYPTAKRRVHRTTGIRSLTRSTGEE